MYKIEHYAGGLPVVPHAGTWIEISADFAISLVLKVVPHAGTWIEIPRSFNSR